MLSSVRVILFFHEETACEVVEGVDLVTTSALHRILITLYHLLWGELQQLTLAHDKVSRFEGRNCRKGPVSLAVMALIADGANSALLSPINTIVIVVFQMRNFEIFLLRDPMIAKEMPLFG